MDGVMAKTDNGKDESTTFMSCPFCGQAIDGEYAMLLVCLSAFSRPSLCVAPSKLQIAIV